MPKRLRKQTEVSNNSITIPVYFENRFEDKTHILRVASSLLYYVFLFDLYRFSRPSPVQEAKRCLKQRWGVLFVVGLIIGGVIFTGYTFTGGFKAVAWTDLIQGIIMFFAIIAIPIIIVCQMGGFEGTAIEFERNWKPQRMKCFHGFRKAPAETIDILLLVSSLGWGLGYSSVSRIVCARFMRLSEALKK